MTHCYSTVSNDDTIIPVAVSDGQLHTAPHNHGKITVSYTAVNMTDGMCV